MTLNILFNNTPTISLILFLALKTKILPYISAYNGKISSNKQTKQTNILTNISARIRDRI